MIKNIQNNNKLCFKCQLRKQCNHVVAGNGDVAAQLMIIGSYPYNTEDITGEAFSSIEGKYFKKLVQKSEILSNEVYYTYLIKCKPNKKIKKIYIETCKYWLHQEIITVKPKIIISLGSLVTNFFVKKNLFKEDWFIINYNNIRIKVYPCQSLYQILKGGKSFDQKIIRIFQEFKKNITT